MLKVVNFINEHKDWEELLTQKPYCLEIKREDGFILFAYSQIDSDFYNEIVRECRGLILDEEFNPVCVPFYKFGNYGEGYAPEIDWSTARVQEKVDGSIIKLWYDHKDSIWRISTNGTIFACTAKLPSDVSERFQTFQDLFIYAAQLSKFDMFFNRELNIYYTYMFELTSPYNRVVVPYSETSITHIGTRDNRTLEELDVDVGIKKPKSYTLSSIDDCVEAASKLGYEDEGFVVVDANWNRVKIKSPSYVALHHLRGNGIPSKRRIVSLIRANETDEILNYFPEFEKYFVEIRGEIHLFVKNCNEKIEKTAKIQFNSRKSFAEYAKEYKFPVLLFLWYDGKIKNAEEWLWNYTDRDIVDMIEREDYAEISQE